MKARRTNASRLPRSQRRDLQQGPIKSAASIPVINPHAAGIDVGSVEHWVCVPEDSVPAGSPPDLHVRPFGAFTADLDRLVDWLRACGIQTVAVEATGVYWIALVQKLEAAQLEAIVSNARHLKNVPGRKSDVKDCQWIQQLHSYGLLNGSFRPSQDICALRSLMRHRDNLVASCAREVQHIQKALQQMNLHLHHAVSEVTGATGLRILDAILAGQRDARQLARLRDEQCHKTTVAELEKALEGDWRAEHLFVLEQSLQNYRHYLQQLKNAEVKIEQALAAVVIPERAQPEPPAPPNPAPRADGKGKKKRFVCRKDGPSLKRDFTAELQRICGVDLTQVVGLNVLSVLIILSEIGLDMSRWRDAKAFCSWLGLCPGNKISGGKVLDSRTVHVVNRVSILLRTLAPSIGRTETWLGIFHRRMKARLGPGGANTATARKLAGLIYHLLRYQEDYIDVDQLFLLEKIRKQRIVRLRKQAEELGLQVTEKQQAA
jgi:transposase